MTEDANYCCYLCGGPGAPSRRAPCGLCRITRESEDAGLYELPPDAP
ncbi:MAG: hypothetical protein LC679_16010 [Intrasporangiaceae bacterium]|nr:hypothetical protein [Intrasporangiaceae bacterium]